MYELSNEYKNRITMYKRGYILNIYKNITAYIHTCTGYYNQTTSCSILSDYKAVKAFHSFHPSLFYTRFLYSWLSLSRPRLSRITAYLEVKIWSLPIQDIITRLLRVVFSRTIRQSRRSIVFTLRYFIRDFYTVDSRYLDLAYLE